MENQFCFAREYTAGDVGFYTAFVLWSSLSFSFSAIPSSSYASTVTNGTSDISKGISIGKMNNEPTSDQAHLKEIFSISYFSVLYGPGLHPETYLISPNQMGFPENDGMSFQNQISLRYKFSGALGFDLQLRNRLVLNNAVNNPSYSVFRWETPRVGVSGKLAGGEDWSLIGAVNTDFPYFLPHPLTGYQAQQRTVIFTPGMFAGFKYEPRESRWSVFSVVSPRYFFYKDRDVAESQFMQAGYIPGNKPEVILAFQPTINYKISSRSKISVGSTLDYRKHVVSEWNPLRASLVTNGADPAWRLSAVPITLGVTYTIGTYLTLYPYISAYPIAAQRVDSKSGRQASLLQSSSLGMWLSGAIF